VRPIVPFIKQRKRLVMSLELTISSWLIREMNRSILEKKERKKTHAGKENDGQLHALLLDVNAAAIPEVRGRQAVHHFVLVHVCSSGAGEASGRRAHGAVGTLQQVL
jgi:hypothetical protein